MKKLFNWLQRQYFIYSLTWCKILNWLYEYSIGWLILQRFIYLFNHHKFKQIPIPYNKSIKIFPITDPIWHTGLPWGATNDGDITTYGTYSLYRTAGRIDIGCKLGNKDIGYKWPALWLLNLECPQLCEVDIIEYMTEIHGEENILFTNHWNRYSTDYDKNKGHRWNGTHCHNKQILEYLVNLVCTYTLIWTKWYLAWYINGILVKFTLRGVPKYPMYIVISNIPKEDIKFVRIS